MIFLKISWGILWDVFLVVCLFLYFMLLYNGFDKKVIGDWVWWLVEVLVFDGGFILGYLLGKFFSGFLVFGFV